MSKAYIGMPVQYFAAATEPNPAPRAALITGVGDDGFVNLVMFDSGQPFSRPGVCFDFRSRRRADYCVPAVPPSGDGVAVDCLPDEFVVPVADLLREHAQLRNPVRNLEFRLIVLDAVSRLPNSLTSELWDSLPDHYRFVHCDTVEELDTVLHALAIEGKIYKVLRRIPPFTEETEVRWRR